MSPTGIQAAIDAAGSMSALARALDVSYQSVQQWRDRNRVPAERVLDVEAATGISRHDLRPDLYPRLGGAA